MAAAADPDSRRAAVDEEEQQQQEEEDEEDRVEGLPPALAHALAPVWVRTGRGRLLLLRLPALAAVSDVVAAVQGADPAAEPERFLLARAGRELDGREPLAGLGLAPGDCLEVRRPHRLRVTLADRSVRWRGLGRLSFAGLVSELSVRARLPRKALAGRMLVCVGCGRRLTAAGEPFQQVPADCCRVRSLELEEPAARERGTQTATQAARRHASVGRCPETASAETQTEGTRSISSQQTEGWRTDFWQQHPPIPPLPLLVSDYVSSRGGKRVLFDVQLDSRASVGSVRAAVASSLGLGPAQLELQRVVGRSGRRHLFLVCDDNGSLPSRAADWEFGTTEEGARLRRLRRHEWDWRALNDDDADFAMVPGRRNHLIAYPRREALKLND